MNQNSPNGDTPTDNNNSITDRETVRERLVGTIKKNTSGKRVSTVKEASLLRILSSNNIDIDVASQVLADLVSDGEVVLNGDDDGRHRYRLTEESG